MAERISERRPLVEDLVAQVSAADRDLLLRVYRHRLPRPDLEDCLQQATLELVLAARRGALPADTTFIGGALQNKFKSRIIDVHRATAGRSPAAAANARSVSIDGLADMLPGPQDTARDVIVGDELHRIAALVSQLTPDQRLVLASQTFGHDTPAEFCQQHGWGLEKYRKVAQRGRARLQNLLEAPTPQRDTPPLAARHAAPADAAPSGDRPPAARRTPNPRSLPVPVAEHDAPAPTGGPADAPLSPLARTGIAPRSPPDPLAAYRRVLGDERADRLSELADEAATRVAGHDRPRLLAERDSAAVAWRQLDRGGAYETRTVQRDRDTAHAGTQTALAAATSIEERSANTGGQGQRGERDALERAAAVQRRIANSEQRTLTRHASVEQRLHDEGRHLDDWMQSHATQAATWLAAERELATRREHHITRAIDAAVAAPSTQLLDRLGDPPVPDAPQRPEWERLARHVEYDRLQQAAASADGSTPASQPAADRDLERRIRQLQRDPGHERAGRTQQRDTAIEL